MQLEFRFTEHDTPALRRRIERDLAHVARRARSADEDLVALVLTGGFSRGEGTARLDAPVNDYDLVAIRRRPGGAGLYARLSDHLTGELGIHIDLLPIWRARLPFVGRKLFWLDLRLGGRVIEGDADALARLRAFPPARVSHAEIARLLGNRAAGMLLSLPTPNEPADAHQRDLQATKAALAAMDGILLHRGLYTAKMRDRLDLTHGHRDNDTFRHAVEWKLGEGHALPGGWWERARDTLLRAVDETGALGAQDGLIEYGLHLVKARRLRPSPSQSVRRAAWELLAQSTFPQGPADLPSATRVVRRIGGQPGGDWAALKRTFFAARARTLQ